jgi:GST-like protein
MIDLYTWTTPNGRKAPIALEEMGLEYRVHPVDIGQNQQFAPDFLVISPNNKIPAIVDHDPPHGLGDGPQSVFESGAILVYLAEKTGKLLEASGPARVAALEWTFWQVGGPGTDGRPAGLFRPARARADRAGHRPLRRRGAAAAGGDGGAAGEGPLSGGPGLFDRRHRLFRLDQGGAGDPGEDPARPSPSAGGAAWLDRVGERAAVRRGMAVPNI